MPHADPQVRRDYMRGYKLAHKEKLRAQNRTWRKRRSTEDPEFRSRERSAEKRYRDRNPEKVLAKSRREREQKPMFFRERNLQRLYGLGHADYERMLKEQGGCCAICGGTDPGPKKRYFSVDHDHDTGEVRGLVCDGCNNGLARFKDSPQVLRRAAEYLERQKRSP